MQKNVTNKKEKIMFYKNLKKIGIVAITTVIAVSMQTQSVQAVGGLQLGVSAGADSIISQAPALLPAEGTAIATQEGLLPEIQIDGADNGEMTETEDTVPEEISFSAGSGSLVSSAVQPLGTEPLFTDETEAEADADAEEENAGRYYGYTNLGVVQVDDHLNVRETSDSSSKIVGKMVNDAGCEVLGIENGKAHITSGSVEGYVSLDYLLTGPDAIMYAATIVKELATVTADGLKLREEPTTESGVVSMVAYGEELEVKEKLDGWVAVDYDGQKVYVSADYVTVDMKLKTALNMTEFLYGEGVSDVRVELCEYAKQFIGNPYVWGGTSLTKGADCSGFVLSVFKKYGISLPHSSRAQANCGTSISLSEAKPGDLVFYAKGKRINHVGIYIGGGQIVNASSPKTGIRISNVHYRTPVKVVRILQD